MEIRTHVQKYIKKRYVNLGECMFQNKSTHRHMSGNICIYKYIKIETSTARCLLQKRTF